MTKRLSIAPLFVPAHQTRMRNKVEEMDLHGITLDLEDAVPAHEKDAARLGAKELIARMPGRCTVRINPVSTRRFGTAAGLDDLCAVVAPGLIGVAAPKIESPSELHQLDEALSSAEEAAGLPVDSIALGIIIETALGISRLHELAFIRLARPTRLSFGMGDFTTDLGVEWTRDEDETTVPRALVAILSRAAGLAKPGDSVFTDVTDMEGLRASALRGKHLGYGGKSAIHPMQIPVIIEAYRPTDRQVLRACKIVAAADARGNSNEGAFLVEGRMVDEPIVVSAREVLAFEAQFTTLRQH